MTATYTARHGWSSAQKFTALGVLLLPALVALHDPALAYTLTTFGVALISGCVVLFKVASVIANYSRPVLVRIPVDVVRELKDEALPSYSILCPLYDEASLVPQLLLSLSELDYPRERLDIILLVEAHDLDTRAAVEAHAELLRSLGGRCLIVPDELGPRTKPRACNAALQIARGELLTIYDAEDWPEPDQLRKAVAAFGRLDAKVACLQCKLNYHNYDTNLLTRLFTLEYTAWYDVFLPGLRALGGVIPLGGTSNHFRMAVLRQLGGWDAYNVTEDCDLGIRLARAGFRTELLDSTTWEEACASPDAWLRQRSKWTKGYVQTLVVHTRGLRETLRDLGLYKTLSVLLSVGGSVFASVVLLPSLLLSAFALWSYGHDPSWRPDRVTIGVALSLAAFLPYVALVHALAVQQRRRLSLIPYAALLPAYWVFGSVAAIRGLVQFFTNPFQWEKTPHFSTLRPPLPEAATEGGALDALRPTPLAMDPLASRSLASTPVLPEPAASLRVRARQSALRSELPYTKAATALGLALALVILPSALLHPDPFSEREYSIAVDKSWFGRAGVQIELRLLAQDTDTQLADFAALTRAFVVVDDGEWYEHEISSLTREGQHVGVLLDLEDGWEPRDGGPVWGPRFLRHIRKVGLRQLMPQGVTLPELSLTRYRLWGTHRSEPLRLEIERPFPAQAQTFEVIEARFSTGKEWKNPFDAAEVAWQAVIQSPGGAELTVPAFYTRDYARSMQGAVETLSPESDFFWAVRFAAAEVGTYRWHLEGKDHTGQLGHSPTREIVVSRSDRPGHVRVDRASGRFVFDNGEPHYPVGINLAAPRDGRSDSYDFETPDNAGGAAVMEAYLESMKKSGITLGRVWLSPWFGGLEWRADVIGQHGLGQYSLQNAWRIDQLLQKADQLGLQLQLLLYPHGPFQARELAPWGKLPDTQWQDNPYNIVNGGPVKQAGGFLEDPLARAGAKNYLRYVAARFGAYSSVQSWDLWNEVDTVTTDVAVIADWHRQLAPVLRANDLGRHLISTGFRKGGHAEVWALPELDVVQMDAYDQGEGVGLIERLAGRSQALAVHQKPIVFSEFGGAWWGGSMDQLAQNLHDGLWAGWVLGLPSSPMAWWWNLILEKDLSKSYQSFSAYVRGEDLRGRSWRQHAPRVSSSNPSLVARAYQSVDRAYVWIYDRSVTERLERVPPQVAYRVGNGPKPPHPQPIKPLSQAYVSGDIQSFPEARDVQVELRDLADGRYRVEVWDTWQAGAVQPLELAISAGVGRVTLPPLRRDVALKLVRLAPSAPPG